LLSSKEFSRFTKKSFNNFSDTSANIDSAIGGAFSVLFDASNAASPSSTGKISLKNQGPDYKAIASQLYKKAGHMQPGLFITIIRKRDFRVSDDAKFYKRFYGFK
jgi:hypothetical protein